MTPAAVLAVLIALTVAAYVGDLLVRRRSRRALRALAATWRMNYGEADTLRLTPRVAARFPVPGAARIVVRNVIYGIAGDQHRYLFTAEYTVGAVHTKRRLARVGSFSERRDREQPASASPIVLAPEGLSLVEQYRRLAPQAPVQPRSEPMPD